MKCEPHCGDYGIPCHLCKKLIIVYELEKVKKQLEHAIRQLDAYIKRGE